MPNRISKCGYVSMLNRGFAGPATMPTESEVYWTVWAASILFEPRHNSTSPLFKPTPRAKTLADGSWRVQQPTATCTTLPHCVLGAEHVRYLAWLDLAIGEQVHEQLHVHVAHTDVFCFADFLSGQLPRTPFSSRPRHIYAMIFVTGTFETGRREDVGQCYRDAP